MANCLDQLLQSKTFYSSIERQFIGIPNSKLNCLKIEIIGQIEKIVEEKVAAALEVAIGVDKNKFSAQKEIRTTESTSLSSMSFNVKYFEPLEKSHSIIESENRKGNNKDSYKSKLDSILYSPRNARLPNHMFNEIEIVNERDQNQFYSAAVMKI